MSPISNMLEIFKFKAAFKLRFHKQKNAILNQITENESFENHVFKKLRFENA
jgi:hypothetical protein